MTPALFSLVASAATGLMSANTAHADASATVTKPQFGIGYKAGNGVGFAGLDLIVSPIPHLSIELQGTWIPDFDTGYAVLPAVTGDLRASGSTPYAKAGLLYIAATLGDTSVSGTGAFANLGYEWKWQSGLGVQLGGGVGYIQEITAISGNQSVTLGGEINPNLEIGVRYRF